MKMGKVTHLLKECSLCKSEFSGKGRYCERCAILYSLLGEDTGMDTILQQAFWDHCFQCEAEIVASVELTPESLTVQCDNCGEVHVIPFEREDILRYIRSGIVREMVADE